jgi:hypothetical protein
VSITIITYAPNLIIQNAIATNTTSASSTSTNGNNITLGTLQVYTEYAKTAEHQTIPNPHFYDKKDLTGNNKAISNH